MKNIIDLRKDLDSKKLTSEELFKEANEKGIFGNGRDKS